MCRRGFGEISPTVSLRAKGSRYAALVLIGDWRSVGFNFQFVSLSDLYIVQVISVDIKIFLAL